MTKKVRKIENSFDKKYVPKERKAFIDFDYLKKLDPEAKKWLAKFTNEYYGADFNIRDTYILEDGKYVRINDRDLRSYRRHTKYYKDENGDFTTDEKYKYSDINIHKTEEERKSCNQIANSMSRDMFTKRQRDNIKKGISTDDELLEYEYGSDIIDSSNIDYLSPEEQLILREEMEEKFNSLDALQQKNILKNRIKKDKKKRLTTSKK